MSVQGLCSVGEELIMWVFTAIVAALVALGIYRQGLRGFLTLPEDEERSIW